MIRTTLLAAALAVGAPASLALAQSGPPGPQDEIIITATRTGAPVVDSTAAGSTLTEADLERRQTRFVADALATLPGVTVSQNGAFGGQATVRLRGASAEQTLVLIDGLPVSDPSAPGGGYNVASLDPLDIAQIEVLRGPQSTLWGSDAIGGVVAIVTRAPEPGFRVRSEAEAGSFGAARAAASLSYAEGGFDLRLGGSATGADGISKADRRDGNTETDDFDGQTADGRVGLTLSPALRVEAFARQARADTEFDSFGFATGVTDGPELSKTRERSYGARARFELLDGAWTNTVLAARSTIARRNFSNGAFSFGADGARDLLRYQGDVAVNSALNISFGAEREEIEARGNGAAQTDSLFVLAEARPIERLLLSAGVRRDDHSAFGDATAGRLGARYTFTPAFGVRASWGEGFKAPSLFQLTSSFGALPPNGDLLPERADGWDAAVFGEIADWGFSYEIGYFDLEVQDQIDFSFATFRYENIAKVASNGVEASAQWSPSESVSLSANYTYTDASNGVTGVRLIRIPRHAAYVEADWRASEALGLTLALRHNGAETDIARPANPAARLDAWTRADLLGRYRLNPAVELFARLENLTDERYQDVFGYGAPGRSGSIGVRLRLP
jgi:vitamin B12 transporter